MSDKNVDIAHFVMDHVGGEQNVNSLVHCATRLRFHLKDESLVDEEALKNNLNILAAQSKGGQYQVVIGNNVSKVYDAIIAETNVSGDGETEADPEETAADTKQQHRKRNPLSVAFEYISGTFSPLIPALAGSGMIKALLAVFALFDWYNPESATALVLNAASSGLFYFFPIFIAISAGKYLKVNPYVAGVIGAGLMDPNFAGLLEMGDNLTFAGLPLIVSDYSQTVFPMLVAIAIYALLERFLKKYIPDTVQLFMVPMLGILIMVPLTALVFGPFSQYFSNLIAEGLVALLGISSTLTGIIMAAAWPFLVILGVHWGITPIGLENLKRGGDPLNAMAAGATFSQMGIAFGVFLRYRKNENLRSLASAATISGVLAGVTEPILYGLVLRYKRLIPIMIAGSVVGGGLAGFFNTKMLAYAFNSVLTIPAYDPIPQYVIAITAAFVVSAVLTYIFGVGEDIPDTTVATTTTNTTDNESSENNAQTEATTAATTTAGVNVALTKPIKGQTIALEQVSDPVFSSGAMGKGVAIKPSDGELRAPVSGEVILLPESKHAVGLKTADGVELLMHVGLDTVELNGEPFQAHVAQGDHVEKGDLLLMIDLAAIQAAGKETVTPVLVTNAADFSEITVNENAADDEDIIVVK